jgi:hypothetical protein
MRELAREEFKTQDEEELSFEAYQSIGALYPRTYQLIELGYVKEGQFIALEGDVDKNFEDLSLYFYQIQPAEYYENLFYRLTLYGVQFTKGESKIKDDLYSFLNIG